MRKCVAIGGYFSRIRLKDLISITITSMWIQSTIDITREDAIEKALKIFAENNRNLIESFSDSTLETFIEEHFYNYQITNK